MHIHEDAQVAGIKLTMQLVQHGRFASPPLTVQHDRRVAMATDQVPPDK
jgi:hypothetical protein